VREREREREREHIEADAGADTKTTTKIRKRKNNNKKTKRQIETHTWLSGPREMGSRRGSKPPPDSQPQLNILERPDER
jgi:hypothetical protein